MNFSIPLRRPAGLIFAAALAAGSALAQSSNAVPQKTFALQAGDTVVLYGDDVTAQRLYSAALPAFVQTRFPQLNVTWVESGWGDDTTTGNKNWWGGGDMKTRTDRDVKAHHPNVVVIQLGNNDAGKKAFDQAHFDKFSTNYQKVLDKLTRDNPGVRLTVVTPVPYDDVNHQPDFAGGVNGVLAQYAAEEVRLAQAAQADVVNLHAPMSELLAKSKAIDGGLSEKLTDSRWKPAAAAQLFIAAKIAQTWGLDAIVSDVTLDGATGSVLATRNVQVAASSASHGVVTWKQTDAALPLPIDSSDASVKLVLKASDLIDRLDQQRVTVSNLVAPNYDLKIDNTDLGTFTREQLAAGVNLATLKTPMLEQSLQVAQLFRAQQDIASEAFHGIQTWHTHYDPAINKHMFDCIAALHQAAATAAQEAKKCAQPVAHTFTLTPQ